VLVSRRHLYEGKMVETGGFPDHPKILKPALLFGALVWIQQGKYQLS